MAQLRQDYDKFMERETVILVVGPEGANQFRKYWKENDLPFIGLSNPDHSVLKRFGQEVNLFKLGRMPAQVLVDQNGVARFAHYGKAMSDIPENEELLGMIDKINAETQNIAAN